MKYHLFWFVFGRLVYIDRSNAWPQHFAVSDSQQQHSVLLLFQILSIV
jgi:hypothetical protein